ncbi:MAG: IPT/TIG domain-containing protein [Muribaculaceae bacterium]|nr:IPT/TIG domain-containing protein [Muribaculaceae bacterium]
MKTIYKLLLAVMMLPMMWACSDNDYQASVTELRLIRLNPLTVNSGDMVTILGRNFDLNTEDNIVMIGDARAEVIEAKKDELQIIVPEQAPGKYTVSVKCASGELSNLELTYLKTPDHDYLVQTVVGQAGVATSIDGVGTEATIRLPTSLQYAPDGSIWVTTRSDYRIRRIDSDLRVTTIADLTADGATVWQACFNSKGEYFYTNKDKGLLRRFDPETKAGVTIASGLGETMNVCCDKDDILYVVSRGQSKIFKFTSTGESKGEIDMSQWNAKVNYCTFDLKGNLICGFNNLFGLVMVEPDGKQTLICGDKKSYAAADFDATFDGEEGNPLTAKIGATVGLTVASDGILYISDQRYHCIRKLVPGADGSYLTGTVTTIAGNGSAGRADGVGMKATFNQPYELLVSPDAQTIYVAQPANHIIRKILIK